MPRETIGQIWNQTIGQLWNRYFDSEYLILTKVIMSPLYIAIIFGVGMPFFVLVTIWERVYYPILEKHRRYDWVDGRWQRRFWREDR